MIGKVFSKLTMVSFQKTKLGDLAEIVMGQSPESKYYNETGNGLPFFQGVKDFGEKYPIETKWTTSANKVAETKDILFSVRAPVGEINVAKKKSALGRGVCAIRSKNNQSEFLYFLLRANIEKIINVGNGAVYDAINKPTLEKLEFRVPDLPTQKRIASVLSAYDDMIENNEKRIKTLEEMAKLFYIEWFVKFKFPGHEKVKIVKNKFGKIPEHWETKQLNEVSDIKGGKYLPREQIKEVGPFPVFGGNGVQGYSDKSTHNGFVIIFGRVGAYCGSIYWSYNGAWLNNNSSSIVPKQYNELILEHLRRYNFINLRGGAAQPFISNDALGGILLAIPTPEVAKQFCNIMESIRVQQIAIEKINISLCQTRDLLIPQLVTGRRELK